MKLLRITAFLLCLLLTTTGMALAKPVITSDSSYLDVNTGRYILEGHVRVDTGSRVITADKAQVSIASLEVWGQGNITLVQDDIHFTGDRVYVNGNDHEATITGTADFERTGLSITSGSASFNWETKIADFYDHVTVTRGDQTSTSEHVSYNVIDDVIL